MYSIAPGVEAPVATLVENRSRAEFGKSRKQQGDGIVSIWGRRIREVAVRRKADAPGQGGVRRRIPRGELLLDAGFDIDRDQPLGVSPRRVAIEIERNERQRCLIKKRRIVEALVALGTRETVESPRRDHRPAMILSHY
jgi:hypothetical protein